MKYIIFILLLPNVLFSQNECYQKMIMKYLILLAFLFLASCTPQKEVVYLDMKYQGYRTKWTFTKKVLKSNNVRPGSEVSKEVLADLILESLKN
jgi:hypothetical protein